MRAYLTTHLTIALFAVILAAVILGSAWYIDETHKAIELRLTHNIEVTNAKLHELAIITDRNGADVLTDKIISDCPRRGEFEKLLVV